MRAFRCTRPPVGATIFTTLLALTALANPLQAEETANAAPALSIEFNSALQLEGTCRLTFFVENGMGTPISGLSLEAVLFTTQGTVERLTLFDLGDLPQGRPRVRQFDVPDLQCDTIGQILINGLSTCEGNGLTPATCLDSMTLKSRTDLELIG